VRALSLRGSHEPALVDVAIPQPGPGQVLVKISACGVCGSDLNAWRGVLGIEFPLAPGAPGHETIGTVAAVGRDVDSAWCGKRVTGLMWNGFAEYGVADIANLVDVPREFPELLGEPLACAANVVRRASIGPNDDVAIVGFGYLAALIVQCLPRPRPCWTAIARRASSRELALSLGAANAYDFREIPSEAWDHFPVVIESTGAQQPLDHATWLTAFGGRLVIAGYHADGPRTVNMQSWNWKGIDVINAHEREPAKYVAALRGVMASEIRVDILHTHTWSLSDIGAAFAAADLHGPGFIKAVVRP
jgi:D-arabinose 1-dehydrogenase-like Zn-dependent alcohol dehydrogenase